MIDRACEKGGFNGSYLSKMTDEGLCAAAVHYHETVNAQRSAEVAHLESLCDEWTREANQARYWPVELQ